MDSFDFKTNEILQTIGISKKVAILTHINPDGDAIGSSLALCNYLATKNIDSYVLVPNKVPEYLLWMSLSEKIVTFEDNKQKLLEILSTSDAIFCLDFNSLSRINAYRDDFLASRSPKILIDHHPFPEKFCNIEVSTTMVSSTAELVFEVLTRLDSNSLNQSIATCLYVGIVTDTGSFQHNCSRPQTFNAVGELMKFKLNKDFIHQQVFHSYSENRLRLLGFTLHSRLKIIDGTCVAYLHLSQEDLLMFNFKEGDTEGFVNYPLSISGVNVAGLFIEKKDKVKISLRSTGDIAVNEILSSNFKGGGHKNAAGGESNLSLSETLEKFEYLILNSTQDLCRK